MFIAGNEPDIIMITEVIPKQQKHAIPPSLLHIDDYVAYFNFNPDDENLGNTGIRGTAIYVKSEIISLEAKLEESSHKDQVWVEIPLCGSDKLLCGCIYRSPSGNTEEIKKSTKDIQDIFQFSTTKKASHLLIAGDFNLKDIDWEHDHVEKDQTHLLEFVNTVQNCFLYQQVKQPTRFRSGETSNVLDLIFTNEEGLISEIDHLPG